MPLPSAPTAAIRHWRRWACMAAISSEVGVLLVPIPSLWGHTAGAASNPADEKFLNETIGKFLRGDSVDAQNVVFVP